MATAIITTAENLKSLTQTPNIDARVTAQKLLALTGASLNIEVRNTLENLFVASSMGSRVDGRTTVSFAQVLQPNATTNPIVYTTNDVLQVLLPNSTTNPVVYTTEECAQVLTKEQRPAAQATLSALLVLTQSPPPTQSIVTAQNVQVLTQAPPAETKAIVTSEYLQVLSSSPPPTQALTTAEYLLILTSTETVDTSYDVCKSIFDTITGIKNGRAVFLSSRRVPTHIRDGFQIKSIEELHDEYTDRFDDPQFYKAGV